MTNELILGLDFKEYQAIDAQNMSGLKPMSKSPGGMLAMDSRALSQDLGICVKVFQDGDR
jgi:hypothetical protein